MKRTVLATFIIVALFILSQSTVCSAAVSLPWSTTYDCSDWVSGTNNINCDGLDGGLTCDEGPCDCESITNSANYPEGAGGKGQRHPICAGSGNSGGGSSIHFNSLQRELWIRWYMKYDTDFTWNQYRGKLFYLYTNAGVELIPEWEPSSFSFTAQGASYNNEINDRGFDDIMGSGTGDGDWHYYEIHIKADTNGSNGIAELWVDNLPVRSLTTLNFGMSNGSVGWTRMTIGSNYNSVSVKGNCDFDDISISNTSRIGPIGSTPITDSGVTPAPVLLPPSIEPSPSHIFSENFEDVNFADRSWYDNTNLTLTTDEHVSNSTKSVEFSWQQGGASPISGGAIRKLIPETDEVYLRYYVKYSANWQGSNTSTHPHEFYLLTNLNGMWDGLAYTYLTAYIEQNEGEPLFAIQDSQNIDVSRVGQNLTSITENRAVGGCNGDSDGFGDGSCYSNGSVYFNGKFWRAGTTYFRDTTGPYYKNDWHLVEAYIKMNTISNGKANKDGQMKYWFDGTSVMNRTNVVIRTGQYPNMKFNQFVIGPYMGSSPVAQKMWIDNLYVGTSRPTSDGDGALAAPSNLHNVSP